MITIGSTAAERQQARTLWVQARAAGRWVGEHDVFEAWRRLPEATRAAMLAVKCGMSCELLASAAGVSTTAAAAMMAVARVLMRREHYREAVEICAARLPRVECQAERGEASDARHH